MENFAEFLSARRQQLGKSQSDFARALNYSVQAVAKYEKGRSEMNVASLIAAARFLEVDVDSLCAQKAEKNNDWADKQDFDAALFASNLSAIRNKAKLTPEEAAKRIGVSPRSIINYEKGRSAPSLSVFLALSECYNVKPSTFFFTPVALEVSAKAPAKRAPIHFLPLWIAIASLAVVGTGVGIPLYLSKKNAATNSSFSSEPDPNPASSQASSAASSSADSSTSSSEASSSSSSTSSSSATSSSSSSSTTGKVVTATIDQGADGLMGGSTHAVHFFENGIEVTDQNYYLAYSYTLSDSNGSDYAQRANDFYLDYRLVSNEAPLKIAQYKRDSDNVFRSYVVAYLDPISIKPLVIADYGAECVVAQNLTDYYEKDLALWESKQSTTSAESLTVKNEGKDAGYLTAEGNLNVQKSDATAMAWLARYDKACLDSLYANDMVYNKKANVQLAKNFYSYCYSNA
jgi:transcriptional regulator with XRE-family HTH domain